MRFKAIFQCGHSRLNIVYKDELQDIYKTLKNSIDYFDSTLSRNIREKGNFIIIFEGNTLIEAYAYSGLPEVRS